MSIRSLPRPKKQALKFVQQMFVDRKYNVDQSELKFNEKHKLVEFYTQDAQGKLIIAIFAACKPFQDIVEIEDIEEHETAEDFEYDVDVFIGTDKKYNKNKNKNAGTDFMKLIIRFCNDHNIKTCILVTDFITSHAIKHINKTKNVDITHFTYSETCVENISKHVYQPYIFQILSAEEKKNYIRQHPLYQTELFHYSVDDALVKYYGLQVGDIVYVEYSDQQSGVMCEHRLIVEHL